MGLENLCEVHQPLQHNDFIFVLEFYSWERDWEVSALTGGLKIGNGNGDWKRLTLPILNTDIFNVIITNCKTF